MAVGFAITKADIDNRAGQLILNLRNTLQDCTDLCALFNDTTIFANNQAFLDKGWTQQEVDWLRGAFTDIGGISGSSLHRIAKGLATLGGVNDFFFNGKHLTGVL